VYFDYGMLLTKKAFFGMHILVDWIMVMNHNKNMIWEQKSLFSFVSLESCHV
jgi:NADH:ubiquinone oxidoreductase subunit F (NADH-binding)